jgi:hypothetical protein
MNSGENLNPICCRAANTEHIMYDTNVQSQPARKEGRFWCIVHDITAPNELFTDLYINEVRQGHCWTKI